MAKIKSITFGELLLSLFTDMSVYAEEGSAKHIFNAPCFYCVCQHLMHAVSNNTVLFTSCQRSHIRQFHPPPQNIHSL